MLEWLREMVRPGDKTPPEILRARELISAVDSGGAPPDREKIDAIAQKLGLEVHKKAPVEDTIQRIRMVIQQRVH